MDLFGSDSACVCWQGRPHCPVKRVWKDDLDGLQEVMGMAAERSYGCGLKPMVPFLG